MTSLPPPTTTPTPARTPSLDTLSLTHDGYDRRVHLYIPAYPRLAVLLLHPTASSGKAAVLSGRWLEQSGVAICAPDGLLKYPDAPSHPQDNVRCWSSGETAVVDRNVDDVGFLNEVVARFQAMLPLDTPICLVGHSNGCAMGFALLGQAEHPFEGAVLANATWAKPTTSVRRIPVLYIASSEDPVFPLDGPKDVVTPWFAHRTDGVNKPQREWLRATGLGDEIPDGPVRNEFGRRTEWHNEAGNHFAYQLLEGQGHHWPAGQPIPAEVEAVLGPNRIDLCATTLAMEFLRQHVRSH